MVWTDTLLFFQGSGFLFMVGLLSSFVGSFLNVVIYRLPIMLQRDWQTECKEFLNISTDAPKTPFNLFFPGSHCPRCNTPIKPWYNIPILGYLGLRGKSGCCWQPIPLRYPGIEFITILLSLVVAMKLGYGWHTLFGLVLTWGLLALMMIDFDHQLLPDCIVLPLLWLGLLINVANLFTPLSDAVIGAASGYLTLWLIMQLFKLLTGKIGMGHGDFKLLALFGAWLGWQILPFILLFSALLGAIVGITLVVVKKQDYTIPLAFGLYLAIAGWIALLWSHDILQWYLASISI